MRYALLLVAAVAWALWLGSTIAVFVFGGYFSTHLPPDQFHAAANAMFAVFRVYQLVVGGATVAAAGLAFVTFPSRWTLGTLACCIASLITAIVFLAVLMMMEGLREQGMTATHEWRQLHGQSMATLALQAVILLGAGSLLVMAAIRKPAAAGPIERGVLVTA